jgi:hypothetical protein
MVILNVGGMGRLLIEGGPAVDYCLLPTDFINAFAEGEPGPQGLKPAFLADPSGTAEAVPFPKPIYETSSTDY